MKYAIILESRVGFVGILNDGICFHVSRPTPNFRILPCPIFTVPPTVAYFEADQIRRCLGVNVAVRNVFTPQSVTNRSSLFLMVEFVDASWSVNCLYASW